ncbi:MAG: hypothetical protein RUDDFDWM_001011 [Candidatus Fervidibacterota bacterium]
MQEKSGAGNKPAFVRAVKWWVKEVASRGLYFLLRLLYPPRCLVCEDFSEKALCDSCLSQLKFIFPPVCKLCGKPYDVLAHAVPLCSDCRNTKRWFDWCRCAVSYEGVARMMVFKLKYSGEFRLSVEMAKFMVDAIDRFAKQSDDELIRNFAFDLIIPVPLHETRLRERGFNQAELIAQSLSELIGVPSNSSLLIRTRETKPQFELSPKERWINVRDAFRLTRPEAVFNKVVIIVDDVMTVGATLNECAKAVRAGRPKTIIALAFARGGASDYAKPYGMDVAV